MINTRPVDRLEVHVLVDNATDSLSSVPSHVETEFAYLNRKGMRILSGKVHLLRQSWPILLDHGPS